MKVRWRALPLAYRSRHMTNDGVSMATFRAATSRIDALEAVLRQIAATEHVPLVGTSEKVAIMASLARSVLA